MNSKTTTSSNGQERILHSKLEKLKELANIRKIWKISKNRKKLEKMKKNLRIHWKLENLFQIAKFVRKFCQQNLKIRLH